MSEHGFLLPWGPDTPPEACLDSLLHGLPVGRPFSRRLTRAERLALTLADAKPQRHLTLTSVSFDRDEIAAAWTPLRKRIAREPRMPDDLVYFAAPARSEQSAGYHLHCLLWTDYLHLPTVIGHARDTGFGTSVHITEIGDDPRDKLRVTSYVLGQTESVFGSKRHVGNAPRPKGKRAYLRPQDATLASVAPEVLSTINRAQSQDLSDDELAQTCPRFSKRYRRPNVASYPASEREAA